MLKSRDGPCSIYHVLSFYWRLGGRNEYWKVGRNFLIVFVFFGGCTYRDLAWRVLRICDRFENFNQSFR